MYKVIVVEDETIARRGIVLTTDWASLNCAVAGEAANGEEGLALAQRIHPDIVVTDVKMPRMDGVEMIEHLRKGGSSSKFIILTAHSDFKYAQSALRMGVSDYLLKPLKDGDLEQALTQIIGQMEYGARTAQTQKTAPAMLNFNLDRSGMSRYVEEAIQYIREHHREDITISTVAGFLQISEGYLSRVFKKETDYTFTNYLTYYRIQLAMNLLKDCRLKVYEAADQAGYSDTAYFSAQFKKVTGLSPSEYQEKCR